MFRFSWKEKREKDRRMERKRKKEKKKNADNLIPFSGRVGATRWNKERLVCGRLTERERKRKGRRGRKRERESGRKKRRKRIVSVDEAA